MTALRILNIIVWLAVLTYMAPGAWSTVRGKHTRHGDPMRLAVLVTALVMMGFTMRPMLDLESDWAFVGLYTMSSLCGAFIAYAAKSYGRGRKL